MFDRFLTTCAARICARWRTVVAISLAATVLCAAYAVLRLRFNSERNALVNEDLEFNRRFEDYNRNFEGHEYLMAVVELREPTTPTGRTTSAQRGRMREFVRRLAATLRTRPDLFHAVYERIDPKTLGDLALLYLPLADLKTVAHETQDGLPVLRAMARGAGLTGWLAGVRAQMEALAAADGQGAEDPPASLDVLVGLIDRCASAATATGAADQPPTPPLADLLESSGSARLDAEGYFFVANGRLLLLPILPATSSEAFVQIEEPLAFARKAIADLRPAFPDLAAGMTGRPALYADEMATSKHDMISSNSQSVVLVGLLFILGFRSVKRPLLALASLGIAIALTLGFTTAAFGRLNILSSAFGVILVAVGINYGIHVLSHYQAGLRLGLDAAGAIRHTYLRAGMGLTIGATTTAAAFYSPACSDFQGLWELGAIAGTGILICFAVMMITFPAFLAAADRRLVPAGPAPDPASHTGPRAPAVPYGRLPAAALPVTVGLLAAAAAAGLYGRHVGFDYNLLHLQSPDIESVIYEWKLIRSENRSSYCASLARTPEEVAALRAKYLARTDVVAATDALFPEDEAEKRALLAGMERSLTGLTIPPSAGLRLPDFKREVARLRQVVRSYVERDDRAERLLAPLAAALTRLQAAVETGAAETLAPRLAAFESEFVALLQDRFAHLATLLAPGPIRPEALPPEIRRRFVGKDGSLALLVYPRQDVWEFGPMEEFALAVRAIDPHAVGAPIQIYESHKLFIRAFQQTVALSAVAILLLLLLDFRSLRRTLVAASPLAVGIALLLGAMRWLAVPFNFANFFAVPILIGSGVDNGVHLVHAYTGQGDVVTVRGTYRAILLSSLTTILGFGTLFTARHVGLAGLGLLLTLGSAVLLVISLLFVPAVIAVFRRLGWRL